MDLTRDNANKITCINDSRVVMIPDGVFAQGDMLMLFNNSDEIITLESMVGKTFRSGSKAPITKLDWPPRSIVNVVFIQDNLAVMTVEDC
jgi:hypothetical protein